MSLLKRDKTFKELIGFEGHPLVHGKSDGNITFTRTFLMLSKVTLMNMFIMSWKGDDNMRHH